MQGDFFSKDDWTNAVTGVRTMAETGERFIGKSYYGAWIEREFWVSFINTGIVTFFVCVASLSLGTLGGYALSRSPYPYVFWILITALVSGRCPTSRWFRATCSPSFELNLWGHLYTTVIVLVAINQPFTLWMLHSFFLNIPKEIDESAIVDGCSRFQAFRLRLFP